MESLRPRRISEFVEIIWRRKRLLLMMAAAMLIATYLVIRRLPNTYEAHTSIVIGNQMTDELRIQQSPRFSALLEEATSDANLAVLIRKYDLYPEIEKLSDAIAKFMKDLKTETKIREYYPQVPESLKITYRHTSPQKTHQVVSDLTSLFEQANITLKQEAMTEANRLSTQVTEVESRLKQIGPQKDFTALLLQSRNGDTGGFTAKDRAAMASTLDSLSDKKIALERQIDDKKREIAEQEKLVKQAGALPSTATGAAVGPLIAERAKIQGEIQANADKLTEKHPKMVQWRNQIAEMNRQIEALQTNPQIASSSQALTPEAREFRAMKSDLTKLEIEIEITNRDLNRKSESLQKLPATIAVGGTQPRGLDATIDPGARTESENLAKRYSWLLEKQDQNLKIARSTSEAYQIVDKAVLPQFPVAPNKMLLQLLGLVLATVFGLLIAFGVELPRFFLINDERDVEYYLGAPVLAAIPETLTPIERSRHRKLKMTRGLLLVMLAAALVPTIFVILDGAKLFQLLGSK